MNGDVDRREQCLLHNERLKNIDTNVNALTDEFRAFVSIEGPFVEYATRLSVVEAKQSWLGAKIAGIATAISGVAWLVITKFLGGGSG
jgi:hypothetical protein